MLPLYFLIVFSLGPQQQIRSLVIDTTTTLEECATKKKRQEFEHKERLKDNPTERIECLQLMGTV